VSAVHVCQFGGWFGFGLGRWLLESASVACGWETGDWGSGGLEAAGGWSLRDEDRSCAGLERAGRFSI
jgi:hypothetical protein